jgi:hypothetical protein
MIVAPRSKLLHFDKKFGREYLLTHKAQGNKAQRQQQGNETTKGVWAIGTLNVATRHENNSKAQRHEGSTHECNNKHENNNKMQGAKAKTRCKGVKATCMKATTKCEGSNKVQRRESNMHEGNNKV